MSYTVELRKVEFVQAVRHAKFSSDYALARAMGVNRSTVTRVIKGDLRPGPAFIAGALTALHADFLNLFKIVPDRRVSRDRGLPR